MGVWGGAYRCSYQRSRLPLHAQRDCTDLCSPGSSRKPICWNSDRAEGKQSRLFATEANPNRDTGLMKPSTEPPTFLSDRRGSVSLESTAKANPAISALKLQKREMA